jgi:hypothetical protein
MRVCEGDHSAWSGASQSKYQRSRHHPDDLSADEGRRIARPDAGENVSLAARASVTAGLENEVDLSIGHALAIDRPTAENTLTSIELAF